jgi:hypothetical protein
MERKLRTQFEGAPMPPEHRQKFQRGITASHAPKTAVKGKK